jgi:Zn-dependent protease/predicted transcriptional regulator
MNKASSPPVIEPLPANARRRRGIRLGRLAGVDVHADWSLAIIVVLVALSLGGGVFPSWHPDWSAGLVWATALAASLLLVVSIVVHELSHALAARRYGMAIRRITLFMFGGIAELEQEPHGWRAELWVALVGPVVSLLLGLLMIALGSVVSGADANGADDPIALLRSLSPLATVLLWLGPINLVLAAFNLLPGFPLDGGRVVRALLWGLLGDVVRATRWAAAAGQAIGWLLVACGVAMLFGLRVPVFGGGLVGGVWLMLIGWFLSSAAAASYARLIAQHRLADVPVGRLMLAPVRSVSPDTPVQQLVDDFIMQSDQRAFPVVDHGRLAGIVSLEDVRRVDVAERATQTVAAIMTPAAEVATLTPADDAAAALRALSGHAVNQLPVVDGGQVRGLVRREDLLRWISLHDLKPAAA